MTGKQCSKSIKHASRLKPLHRSYVTQSLVRAPSPQIA